MLRGWMQICILVSHIAGTVFGWFIHAAWGLSDSSEQFLFLSGLGLGSVFALKAAREGPQGGPGAAMLDLARRTWRLWVTHLSVLAGFGALVWLLDRTALPGEAARLGWAALFAQPWLVLPAAFGLHQPDFTGILPSFLFAMLMLPALMAALEAFGARAVLVPVGIYLAVQVTGWMTPAVRGDFAFDPLAWQVVFLGGAFLGRRLLLEGRAVGRNPWLLGAAVLVLAFGLLVRLQGHGFTAWPALQAEAVMGKEHLAIPRLLHAAALTYLVAAVLPRDAAWLASVPALWLARIGRQSLTVFAVGLFLSYGATLVLRVAGWSLALDAALVVGGVLALGELARWLETARARAPSGTARSRG